MDKPEETSETLEHDDSTDVIETVQKSYRDELPKKDKEGKSEGSQEQVEEGTNKILDVETREKWDLTEFDKSSASNIREEKSKNVDMEMEMEEPDEEAESEEGEGKSDIGEDELKESLQKIKTYLRKWKKKLTK